MRDEDVPAWAVGWFLFCALLSVATLLFIGWAVYRVVVHFT